MPSIDGSFWGVIAEGGNGKRGEGRRGRGEKGGKGEGGFANCNLLKEENLILILRISQKKQMLL